MAAILWICPSDPGQLLRWSTTLTGLLGRPCQRRMVRETVVLDGNIGSGGNPCQYEPQNYYFILCSFLSLVRSCFPDFLFYSVQLSFFLSFLLSFMPHFSSSPYEASLHPSLLQQQKTTFFSCYSRLNHPAVSRVIFSFPVNS